ncbi:flavin-containing monooxygenase [Fulvivirga sedimenti]|uniref:NAD(P)/FAD-dependent oxidoreductase n=1 Tax=Fulvivirga sedimenti TaxID=2879465 RepID=A0A9X1HYJ4_9BACT|nr:NAD(P)/FAD-dependent oxidoreductase [Fulvivirga sedimenti]MCA6078937.1 NAD(P)/FAD-dependent oxidoreductase [Fulvivirga sedimenti]
MKTPVFDVLIIGAGISGIGTAYWLQKKCPGRTYAILESRPVLGGTWSLFNYPGIRSDSDMFTFGYRFKPWSDPESISSGDKILNYLQNTVTENNINEHILFNHRMVSADWSDESRTWVLTVETPEGTEEMECNFLSICTGYYDYKEAHRPHFKGEETFQGNIVIPQFWPKDLDYTGKRVAVIGSGATAVTLMPSLVEGGAAHVTMIQRSPTYIMNLPNRNGIFVLSRKVLPDSWAYRITRGINITMQMISFGLSKAFPGWMKSQIMKGAAKQLPPSYPVEKHFNPTYNPWDQRLCVVPDGDLFEVINEGKADVVTNTISHFNESGVVMDSGEMIDADVIVLATGLKIQLLGGANLSINQKPVSVSESMMYKGMMVSDIPNLIYTFGYTNASWTLKADLTANYLCKLLNYMDRKGFTVVIPERQDAASGENFLNLSSGYIQRGKNELPKQGKKRPWRVYQNYLVDMLSTRFGRVADRVLKFDGTHSL